MNLPSIKTIAKTLTNGDVARAAEIRRILEADIGALVATDAGNRRWSECYNRPSTADVRMHVLNDAMNGFGVEGIETRAGNWAYYVNMGDTYEATLMHYRGRFFVSSWGDFAEKHAA